MKPDTESVVEFAEEEAFPAPVSGDVIGDTAYSERFVLKILLKLANRDTLKDEILERSFEEELCTLWDMTAEKDVVLYLLRHDVLSLFTFAMPVIDSKRLIEITIGIIANMSCHKETVQDIIKNDDLLILLLDHLKSDDSQVLNQLLRLISSCLFLSDEDDISTWMAMFENVGYADILYFILMNSTNKDLLVTALENLNTLCTHCNVERYSRSFFEMFVKSVALDAVYSGYAEVSKQLSLEDEMGRINVITLQIGMHLVGFNRSPDIFSNNKESAVNMIKDILACYEQSIVVLKKIDIDLADVLESANTIINILNTSGMSNLEHYFAPAYNMWKAVMSVPHKNGTDSFEDDGENVQEFFKSLRSPLCLLLGTYMAECSEDNLQKVLDEVGDNYGSVVCEISDVQLQQKIARRAGDYRSRLNENIDS